LTAGWVRKRQKTLTSSYRLLGAELLLDLFVGLTLSLNLLGGKISSALYFLSAFDPTK
jgi:hypothetical protein